MITVQNLAKAFGGRTLFEGVSLQLNAGSRYGLVGANGSGKTTLLNILSGFEPATDGTVSIAKDARVGVLRQDRFLDGATITLDLAMMGDQQVWGAMMEQKRLIADGAQDAHRVVELEELIRVRDGYTLEARASQVLEGLGIPTEQHRKPLSVLSGGFQLRVLLAQVLIGGADVLLLDEPTNHLDILSIRWLEKFLGGYRGCAVIISHDIRFLDNIATHILDVDYETITQYVGDYSSFEKEKEQTRERKQAEIDLAEKRIAEKKAFVERFGAKATKAKQAQSRLKQIEKIEVEELADSSRRTPTFRFEQERPSGKDVLELKEISKSFGPKRVLSGVSLYVRRGERVGVIGANGLGKSTLLKIAMGKLEQDHGTVRWGHEVRTGYFAQDHREVLQDAKQTPLQLLWSAMPTEAQTTVRGKLGMVLFSGDDVQKPVGALSGGEAARLIFAVINAQKPNVLVLDEPTNHLDVEAIRGLVEGLKSYEGTVIFVSHDRWFVSELATRIIELTPSGISDFPGTYAEYVGRSGDDHLDAEKVALRARQEKKAEPSSGAASWEEQKKKRNRQKAVAARLEKVTASIAAAEARKKAIDDLYVSEGFFERTGKAEVDALEAEKVQLDRDIEGLMVEWEQLEKEAAEAAS